MRMRRTLARLLVMLTAAASAQVAGADVTAGGQTKERDETARALERALVRQGGLVLRPWSIEVEPGLDYAYRDSEPNRRETIAAALVGRLGLPLGAQADVGVPYVLLDRAPGLRSGSGLGDVQLGVTKQLVYGGAGSSRPDLLVTTRWKTTTGASGGDLPPGTGSHSLQAFLTAVARDDPLVLLGSLYYVWNLRTRDLVPGDSAGVILRILLAATPSASLLTGIDAAHVFATTSQGHSVPGSERLSAILELGLSTVLARNLSLNVTTGIGVTSVAPAFRLAFSVPFRL
jgi:hypothetical protein